MGKFAEASCRQEKDDFEENLGWKQGKVIVVRGEDIGRWIFGRGPLEDDLVWRRLLGNRFFEDSFLGVCHVTVGVRH
jgi:hypothetical protein